MPLDPVFYESGEAHLSTEVGYFEASAPIDFEMLLRSSEEDRRQQLAVIQEVTADRDAWIGYFKQLEADRDAWIGRYENLRSQIIALEHDAAARSALIRNLSIEREAALARKAGAT